MMDSYKPLMEAVVTALKADATLSAIVSTRVYSNVPQNETFPYVFVSISSGPYDSVTFSGMEHEITVQGFSRKPSPAEAASIRAAVYNLLHRGESNLTLDVGNVAHIHYNGVGFVEREADGVTWQSLARFRCVVT